MKPGLAYGVQDFGRCSSMRTTSEKVGWTLGLASQQRVMISPSTGRQSAGIIGRTFRFTNRNGRTARAAKTPPLPAPRASGGDRGRRPVDIGGDQGRRPVDNGGDRGRRKGRQQRRSGETKKKFFSFLHLMMWRPSWLSSPSASAVYST